MNRAPQNVLVTAAGQSVGRAMAEKFLARGDKVHICDIDGKLLEKVLAANPGPTAEFRAGKEKTFAFLVGQAMKQSRGRAHPEKLQAALRAVLTEESA